jgi:hypothetical protein
VKCPKCGGKVLDPVSIGLKLTCPECEGVLVEFEQVFTREELEVFHTIIEKATDDPEFCQELLQDPERTLEEAGISKETISYLQEVTFEMIRAMNLPPLSMST